MVRTVLTQVFRWMPVLFGIGFIAPLIAQIIRNAGWAPPFGASPLLIGLLVGGCWGAYAKIRGRWL